MTNNKFSEETNPMCAFLKRHNLNEDVFYFIIKNWPIRKPNADYSHISIYPMDKHLQKEIKQTIKKIENIFSMSPVKMYYELGDNGFTILSINVDNLWTLSCVIRDQLYAEELLKETNEIVQHVLKSSITDNTSIPKPVANIIASYSTFIDPNDILNFSRTCKELGKSLEIARDVRFSCSYSHIDQAIIVVTANSFFKVNKYKVDSEYIREENKECKSPDIKSSNR